MKVRRPRTLLSNARNGCAQRDAKALQWVATLFVRLATHGAAKWPACVASVAVVRNAPAQVRVPVTCRGAQDVLDASSSVQRARVRVVWNAPAQVPVPMTRRGAEDVLHALAAVRGARTCALRRNGDATHVRLTAVPVRLAVAPAHGLVSGNASGRGVKCLARTRCVALGVRRLAEKAAWTGAALAANSSAAAGAACPRGACARVSGPRSARPRATS
jgi:hypothetical protein